MNENEKNVMQYCVVKWLLSIKGIGRVGAKRILSREAIVRALYEGSYEELKVHEEEMGLSARFIIQNRSFSEYEKQYYNNCKEGAYVITWWHSDYPQNLRALSDAPMLLYAKGNRTLLNNHYRRTAIVGTRIPTEYGMRAAKDISKAVVDSGHVIVSGMAMGIDTIAHQTALQQNGDTIAVLGCGVDQIYPKINEKLYNKIIEKGLILSEYELGTKANARHFPDRNRIIAGVSERCVVVEAANKSGSLITASRAIEQDRQVFALPGSIYSAKSKGCNELIAAGAMPIIDLKCLDEGAGHVEISLNKEVLGSNPSDFENHLIKKYLHEKGCATFDEILNNVQMTAGALLDELNELEDENIVKLIGFLYQLV